jgi:hypothetical protein
LSLVVVVVAMDSMELIIISVVVELVDFAQQLPILVVAVHLKAH